MFESIWRRKGRLAVFALSFAVGMLAAFAYRVAGGLFARHAETGATGGVVVRESPCAAGEYFASPDEVVAALGSEEVGVRREIFRRLFLRPGVATAFYDYERDVNFPERAEGLRLQSVNLDDSPEAEAVVSFVRVGGPVAVVLKRDGCGWRAVAALGSWLKFEDYPYDDWLELPEVVKAGQHALLVRESRGDAARYTRRARLLRLADGRLEELAEVEEEAIGPLEGYDGADWSEVRRRRRGTISFTPQAGSGPARLRVEYSEDVVRYYGAEPSSLYWREGDGVWHEASRHWRARRYEVVRPARASEEQFVWNEQQSRFVPAGS